MMTIDDCVDWVEECLRVLMPSLVRSVANPRGYNLRWKVCRSGKTDLVLAWYRDRHDPTKPFVEQDLDVLGTATTVKMLELSRLDSEGCVELIAERMKSMVEWLVKAVLSEVLSPEELGE